MKDYTIIDRLIHKPVTVSLSQDQVASLTPGDMVTYKDDEEKIQSWEYLWYHTDQWRKATFIAKLSEEKIEKCKEYQKKADDLFIPFKELFGSAFPSSLPLCARMSHTWHQIYFYFYSDTRYNFSDFVKSFREKVRMRFFLYQVGPRDRVRLHPNHKQRFDPSWLPLMYSIFKHPLPNVESDAISVQWLAWRDAESLKDRSWKFDHTLNFEKEWYEQELNHFPKRWEIIDRYGNSMKCMGCNMLTQEIKLRWKTDENQERFTGEWNTVTLEEYQTCISRPKKTVEKTH